MADPEAGQNGWGYQPLINHEQQQNERSRFEAIARRLNDRYGRRRWSSHGSALDELIATILSQHTSDSNTARSFASLRREFPSWEDVARADTVRVANAIRNGGLADTKAPRIQQVLRAVHAETGAYSLNWLNGMTLSEARSWLTALPGVGPKTASCVLLFSLGKPAMPVDTHVYRLSRRLQLIDDNIPVSKSHESLEQITGPNRDAIYTLHLNLIAHGRAVCKARAPHCGHCVLADLCPASAIPVTATICRDQIERPDRDC